MSRVGPVFSQLASACRHGNFRLLQELSDELHDAPSLSFLEIVRSETDEAGNSLLHISVQNGQKRVAKFLLRSGADINQQNFLGQTVLHFAFSYGFTELAEYLISKGADDSILNKDKLTCYEGLNLKAIP